MTYFIKRSPKRENKSARNMSLKFNRIRKIPKRFKVLIVVGILTLVIIAMKIAGLI